MKDHNKVDIEPGDRIFYVGRSRGGSTQGHGATVLRVVREQRGHEYITVRVDKCAYHEWGYTTALFGQNRDDILITQKYGK